MPVGIQRCFQCLPDFRKQLLFPHHEKDKMPVRWYLGKELSGRVLWQKPASVSPGFAYPSNHSNQFQTSHHSILLLSMYRQNFLPYHKQQKRRHLSKNKDIHFLHQASRSILDILPDHFQYVRQKLQNDHLIY